MFQNLRQGTQIYVLHRGDVPKLDIGEVISVGLPTPMLNYPQTSQFMPQKMGVDVKIKVNEQTLDLQKLPCDNVIADFGNNGIVVATTKEAILSEIESIRSNSQRIIESVDRHEQIIVSCSKLIEDLNPEIRQQAERNKEMDSLKSEMSDMKKLIAELLTKIDNKNGVDRTNGSGGSDSGNSGDH